MRRRLLTLFGAAFVAGLVALNVLGRIYGAFADISDPTHQSANRPLGWLIVAVSLMVPYLAVVGPRFNRQLSIPYSVYTAAAALCWLWLFSPPGN